MAQMLWDGGPILNQASGVFPMGTDSILLGAFAHPGNRSRILDLGTGTGILTILSLFGHPGRSATALEYSEKACELASRNFSDNGISQQVTLIHGDLRRHRELIQSGLFDLTISNPPYFPAGSGPDAAAGLKNARAEGTCTVEDLCQAAAWATKWGGSFCLVFRPERICDLFMSLRNTGFEPKRLRLVRHTLTAAPNLILVEAKRGGNPGLSWENDLVLYTEDGHETPELQAIYHRA